MSRDSSLEFRFSQAYVRIRRPSSDLGALRLSEPRFKDGVSFSGEVTRRWHTPPHLVGESRAETGDDRDTKDATQQRDGPRECAVVTPARPRKPDGRADGSGPSPRGSGDGRSLSRQGRRSRGALLRAARRVFEERGYQQTRIVDITNAADMSVGSFYTYFDSKEEVFHVLLIDVENEVYEHSTRLPRDASPRERIRETNELYLEAFQRHRAFWAAIEEAALQDAEARRVITDRHEQSRTRTERALRGWQDEGIIPRHVDVAFAATALGAMTERCAFLWFVHDEPIELETAVDKLTDLWLAALWIDGEGSLRRTEC